MQSRSGDGDSSPRQLGEQDIGASEISGRLFDLEIRARNANDPAVDRNIKLMWGRFTRYPHIAVLPYNPPFFNGLREKLGSMPFCRVPLRPHYEVWMFETEEDLKTFRQLKIP